MFFWIVFGVLCASVVGLFLGMFYAIKNQDDGLLGLSMTSVFAGVLSMMIVASTWSEHASDLSRVEAQHHRIAVYEERVESLQDRLNNAQYPDKPGISFDADTPWATMMQSLDNAETELAKAKDQRAIAIRSISARKRGPMSGVVTMVGDIDPAMLQ